MRCTSLLVALIAASQTGGAASKFTADRAAGEALLDAESLLASIADQIDHVPAASSGMLQNNAAEASALLAADHYVGQPKSAHNVLVNPVFLIGGDSTRKTPLETPSCLDLFGQRLPVVTSDGVASWSCARWFVRRLSSTAFEIAAARFVSIASDAVRVAEEAGTIAPGTRADRSADEVHRRDGSELCLTATVGGTARAVACARGHGNGALASSLPEQRWSIDPTDGLERSAAFGTAGFPCTVRIKHVGGKCLTRGGPCAMRGMSEAALLKPCDANNARQHWTFAASGAGGVVPCQAGGVAMLPAASDSEGQKRVAMDVALLRFHCETEAKKEFAGILAQESEAAAVPTESSFSVFRTAGIQEKGAEPCLFADVEGKNNGLATTRAKDGSVLVGSGICVPWEVIPTQHGDAQFRVHGSSAAERPNAVPMCMTVALPGKGCNGVRNGCIVLEPCAFDDGERTHHNRFFRQRFRVGAGTQRVRILKVTSSSSRRGKKCVKWMGWGRPAQIVDCEADDHAQEWTRAPSRLIKKNHVDAYRRFSDVYAPVPPTYLAWLVRSHLASKQASIRAKALAAVAHFTPARYTENLTSIPSGKLSNVFSWSLFIPSGVSNTDLYASLIRKDGKYTAAADRAPKTLAEAKKGTQYSGTSFFGKYVDSMLRGLDYVSRHLPGWGVVVHLDPRLHWLEATLLESGIVRIGIMKEGAIRTSGAFWRWIPFDNKRLDLVIAVDADDCADDTSGTVLAHLWEAVVSWAAEPNSMLHSDRWKEHNTMRWLTGWDRGVVDANCGNVQYAPIQANVLGVKPKLLDYSMRDAMAGYALTRMLNPNVDANTGFTRHQPWQLCHNHPGTNLYPSRKHGFMNGHGCGLWSYGHDELFTKQVVFFRATAAGELWSAIPESATAPEHMMVAHVDEHELRCRNAWYLDAMYSVKTPANPIESDFQHLMQSSAAVFSAPLPANKFFSLVQAIPKFGLLDGNSGMSLEPCSPARGVDQSWDLVAPKWAIGTAEENTVCIHRAGPGGSKVCINTPGDPEMWPQLSTHRCWGQCTDDCLQLAKKGRGPRKCDHRSTLHFTIRQHPEGSVQLVSATRQSQEMCVTAVGPRVVEPSASRVNAQAYRTELHQCTTPPLKTQRWYISDTGAISARLQQGTMCITAPTKRSVVPYDDRLLRADCAFLPA